jgi:hypothetical protein
LLPARSGSATLITEQQSMNPKDIRFVIVGDFGKDLDDEDTVVFQDGERRARNMAFVNTDGGRRQDVFELAAVVANLAPPIQRARLAKGTLRQLGQPDVPVGIGTDCGNSAKGHDHEFVNIPYMAEEADLEDGAALLVRTLEEADDNSITLVLISGLTDVAGLLRANADLVRKKVRCAAIMGGVKVNGDAVVLDADGYMEPDTAANNAFDMDSAKYVYRKLQEIGVPLVILTREAAYACKVPRKFYDDLADTGHPVGIKLRDSQKGSIESLWRRANMPAEDPDRGTLPARCNKEWFCDTFCKGQGKDRTGADSIWDLVQSFNLYDPMTLIAAVPELRERFYDPVVVKVGETEHLIIGVNKAVHGVKDANALADYMVQRCIDSLSQSVKEPQNARYLAPVGSNEKQPPVPPPKG